MAIKSKPKSILKFDKPARWWGAMWREFLPTGNGTIGAACQGGAGQDVIMINHNALTWQGYTGVLKDISDKIKETRKQLDIGDYRKANDILSSSLITSGYRPIPSVPLPLCDLKVNAVLERPVKEYSRLINMDSGEVCVSYKDGATKYERNLFVSRKSDYVVYEITRVGQKSISMEFSLDMHDRSNNRTPVAISKLPENAATKYEKFFMYFSARNDTGKDFGAVARISHYGGSMEVRTNSIFVKDAEKIQVVLKPFVESQRDKEWKELRAELAANSSLTYDKLLKEHLPLHSKLMEGVEFDLNAPDRDKSIDELLNIAVNTGDVKQALIEKLWAFGRFLFITSTNPFTKILRPYGLWCGDYKAHNSYVNALGSMQMLYSHAFSGGLAENLMPIFDKFEGVLDDLKKNATRLYNCRGIFVPAVTAPSSGLPGQVEPQIIHATFAAGWIGQLYYDYYLFTRDIKFLKTRALPFMKEVALFYEEFFKQKVDGLYESYPSYSPDNCPSNLYEGTNGLEIARNSMIDFAVAKELLSNLIKGCNETGLFKNELDKWNDMLGRIPNYVITEEGTVKEYLDTRLQDNHNTRSINQLYGIYPGTEPIEKDPDLLKACVNTVKKRFTTGIREHNVQSFAKIANTFARLGDAGSAIEAINVIIRTCLMDNLVSCNNDWRGMGIGTDNAWAAYNLEGNMGITGAIQEMLATSRENQLKILPALPQDWTKGSVAGINTRCGATVDISWDLSRALSGEVKIKARRTSAFDIVFPSNIQRIKGLPQGAKFDSATSTISGLEIPNGKTVVLNFS